MFKILLGISVLLNSVLLLKADERIVGGTLAQPGQFPYQISLQIKSGRQRAHICGGTLVDLRHVVTAAHCVHDRSASELLVWAGANNLLNKGELQDVKKITVHPTWNKKTLDSDIAVLELKNAFKSSTYITPIKPIWSKSKEGLMCNVSGWGTKFSGGSGTMDLYYAQIYIQNHIQCALNYYIGGVGIINNNMICASDRRKDSCQGDSGGPLVSNNTLIGVVSFGYNCAQPSFPGIYTDVHKFADWIQKHSFATCNSIRSIQIIAMFIASTLYTLFFR